MVQFPASHVSLWEVYKSASFIVVFQPSYSPLTNHKELEFLIPETFIQRRKGWDKDGQNRISPWNDCLNTLG